MNMSFALDIDKKIVKELWKYCFSDDDEYVEYYFDKVYDKKNNIILKEDKDILSSIMLNPYKININDEILDTCYVVGVSAFPENRAKGYTSSLIKMMLDYCRKKGQKISMLMPIDTKIYKRYGYANIMDMLTMDINLDRIEAYKDEKIQIKRQKSKELMKDMLKIYEKYSKSLDIYFQRDIDYISSFIDETYLEGGSIFVCYEDKKPTAYMTFYPKHVLNKTGFVREFISNTNSSARALLSMIKSHYTQIENVIIDMDENSNIRYIFSDDNKIKYTLRPFMMTRILDAKYMLEKIDISEDIKIKIKDDIISENNFVYSFLDKDKNQNDFDVSFDIYDLARLIFGKEDVEKVLFRTNQSLEYEKVKILKNIFKRKNSYFNDYV